MTRKLIALVDGSDYSKSVCDHAAWIAKRADLSVEVLHVLGRREAGSDGGDLSGQISLGARSSLLKDLSELDEQRAKLSVRRGRAILEDARAILGEADVDASENLRRGDLIEAVEESSTEAEMILIGKRGEASDFAKEHLGSNLERVMRATGQPLFIASRAFDPIQKVLLAYDGSASAMRAVDYVADSALYQGLPIHVAIAGPENEKNRQRLNEAQSRLKSAGLETDGRIAEGEPEDVLPDILKSEGIGHMVMGASGHSRLRSLFVGSTSLEMIRICKVPILLVK